MVKVHFFSGLRALAGGEESIEVEAKNVGQVLSGVAKAFPHLEETLEENVSVSVDGRIIVNSLIEPVGEDSEVWLLQRLRGG